MPYATKMLPVAGTGMLMPLRSGRSRAFNHPLDAEMHRIRKRRLVRPSPGVAVKAEDLEKDETQTATETGKDHGKNSIEENRRRGKRKKGQ